MALDFNKSEILENSERITTTELGMLLGNIVNSSRLYIVPVKNIVSKENLNNYLESGEFDFYDIVNLDKVNASDKCLNYSHNFYISKVVFDLLGTYIPLIEENTAERFDFAVIESRRLPETEDRMKDNSFVRGIIRINGGPEILTAMNPLYRNIVTGQYTESQDELIRSLLHYSQKTIDENTQNHSKI